MVHDDARLIQGADLQRRARERMLADGARHVGWKAGFGAQASRETLAIDAPLVGFLTDRSVLPADGSAPPVDLGGWTRAIAEAEIAVRVGHDLPAEADESEVLAAVVAVAPAIELADIDIPPSAESVSAILAGSIFHRAVMLGEERATPGGWPAGELRVRVLHESADGVRTELEIDDVEAFPGTTGEVLRTCARMAGMVGPGLCAGDVVILGSVLAPIPMAPGDRFVHTLVGSPTLEVLADGRP